MMTVIPAKSRCVTEVWGNEGAVYMRSEYGTLRVIPGNLEGIVRVSFDPEGVFDPRQGSFYEEIRKNTVPEFHKTEEEVRIPLQEGMVRVSVKTGAVSFWDKEGRLLLRERDRDPRDLEEFTIYQTLSSQDLQVEEIITADGVKKKVKSGEKVACGKASRTRTYFTFDEDEFLTGFGQGEHGEWNLRHQTYYANQANKKIAIPMLVSGKGYGILLSTESPFLFTGGDQTSFIQTEADAYADYYFLFGPELLKVVEKYRSLTGRAAMLPIWAYGYIQCKERYQSSKEIEDTAEEFKRRGIPLDCLVLDWLSWEEGMWGQKSFDPGRFPDPKAMVDKLHGMGIHFMMSIWPNMDPRTDNNREFKERGLLLPGTDLYNAFSKEARELYWSQVERGLTPAGVDGWWCDSSEPVSPEWEHSMEPSEGDKYAEFKADTANIMPLTQANAFGRYHAQGVFEGQNGSGDPRRVVNLTRSGWAGSQKYGAIFWSGDISASWESLKNQVRAGLQMAASGMPYWTLDAGAFFVKEGRNWDWHGDYPEGICDAYKKLYVRWMEYAAYLPMFRAHGTDVEREPWAFGEEGDPCYEALCKTIRNRYRLLPYLYSLGAKVALQDGMLMRPLFFDFPQDPKAVEVSDQYMFGDNLMVCPMVTKEDQRQIYLPEGAGWYDYATEEFYTGGRTLNYVCDLDRIPVFVKAGSVLPVKMPGCCTDAMKDTPIEAVVYPGADGSFDLYEDAGDGYGYRQGEYCVTKLQWKDKERSFRMETTGDEQFRRGEIRCRVVGE